MWPTTIQVILVIALGLPIYFYYEIRYQHSNLKEQLRSCWWMIGYLIFMSVMSYVGSEGFGGQNWIKYPVDFVVIAVASLGFYYWGIKTGLRKIDLYIEKDDKKIKLPPATLFFTFVFRLDIYLIL